MCAATEFQFHLKSKVRLLGNTTAVESFAKLVENNCEGNYFLVEFFSKMS